MTADEEATMSIAALVAPGERVVGVGIDTATVEDSARSIAGFGPAYVRRVCAPSEAATLPGDAAGAARTLAILWAAKEAATKTLAPAETDSWPWPAVEIDLGNGRVRLHGRAGELARAAGIDRVVVRSTDTTTGPMRHTGGGQGDNGSYPVDPGEVTVVALALSAGPIHNASPSSVRTP